MFSTAAFQLLYTAQCDKITQHSLGFYIEQHRLALLQCDGEGAGQLMAS